MCNTFDHNFKYIPLYIMRNVSLEWYDFVLYDSALIFKMSKMALNPFCNKTLHLYFIIICNVKKNIKTTSKIILSHDTLFSQGHI